MIKYASNDKIGNDYETFYEVKLATRFHYCGDSYQWIRKQLSRVLLFKLNEVLV